LRAPLNSLLWLQFKAQIAECTSCNLKVNKIIDKSKFNLNKTFAQLARERPNEE